MCTALAVLVVTNIVTIDKNVKTLEELNNTKSVIEMRDNEIGKLKNNVLERKQIIEERDIEIESLKGIVESTEKELKALEGKLNKLSNRGDKSNRVEGDWVEMTVEATGYSLHGDPTGSDGTPLTATGTYPKPNHTIAVDPRVIPYGTKVYIPEFNQTFVAEDTGGAIKGNKIDIYFSHGDEARKWGRQNITIFVCK